MLRNLSYVPSLSFKAVLSRLVAVLYYVLRAWYCLSVLVYAGLSLFIIVGPYLYLVVCVIYAYNLTLARLIGPTNETKIILKGVKMKALIDTGANMSCINRWLVEKLQLPVQSLQTILNIEGTGGACIPYYGIVECQLGLPEVEGFQKDFLMLVIDDSPYGRKVPVQLGTLHIDMILTAVEQNPTTKLGDSW